MKLQKWVLTAVLLLAAGGLVFAGPKGDTKQQIRMATGGNTGTYYAFGSAVGQILQQKTGIPITIQSTGASKANIQLIQAGEVELAFVQNDVMDYAYKGTDLFEGQVIQDFLSMAAIYAEVCQVVANPAAGISSIADLKGKRVSVGDAGSGTEFNARQILEAYGITFNDITKQNLSFGASADAIKDNKIDAFFCVAGAPTPAIIDLGITKDIVVLDIDDAHVAALQAKYPFYTRFPIPGGSYRSQTGDIKTVAVKATFIVSKKLSEETVYQLTKNIFENKAEITAAHTKGTEISPDYAVSGISVPFHAGATRYYREIGIIK
ncbi:C4-dicarboxylate ABC transporter substrate-binding protein [Spirochaetia bacterium]|nr:C4-dicarboxylate ABC transporter substrate-binding protein [Spirochaetia bacterium]